MHLNKNQISFYHDRHVMVSGTNLVIGNCLVFIHVAYSYHIEMADALCVQTASALHQSAGS